MAGSPSTPYKLICSRRRLTDDDVAHQIRRELPPRQDNYQFEEVDFSQNELSSAGLKAVMDVCKRCPKLRVLKLYKNHIDDGGADGLAELCKHCPNIEEMHLSHNHLSAVGVERLITAAEQVRSSHCSPLWLRLEQNDVADPEVLYRDLQQRLSVCNRMDEVRCTVRVCCRRQKVHLPFFHLQRASRLRDGPAVSQRGLGREPEAAPTVSVAPSRSVVKGNSGGPAPPRPRIPASDSGERTPTSSVWGTPSAGVWSNPAISPVEKSSAPPETGPPENSDKAKPEPPAKPDTPARKAETSGKAENAGQRCSVVCDALGRRRIEPKQLESGDASSQFVCPLCSYVIIRPVITSCSHLFCDTCFRDWVQDQVSKIKKTQAAEGAVPLIPCPQAKCSMKLRKKDIMPMDKAESSKVGAVQLLQRLRNNLQIRCVHHVDHYGLPFGQDAERLSRETGMTCSWIGDFTAYEEHIRKGCPIEIHLGGVPATENGYKNGESPSAAEAAASPTEEKAAAKPTQSEQLKRNGESSTSTPAAAQIVVSKEVALASDGGELRVARYDYVPRETDKAQITLKSNDLVKIFEVTESGWAAGVRLCRETGQEVGDAGWFPAGYLFPPEYVATS